MCPVDVEVEGILPRLSVIAALKGPQCLAVSQFFQGDGALLPAGGIKPGGRRERSVFRSSDRRGQTQTFTQRSPLFQIWNHPQSFSVRET